MRVVFKRVALAALVQACLSLGPAAAQTPEQCEPCYSVPYFTLDYTATGQISNTDGEGYSAIAIVGEATGTLLTANNLHARESAALGFFSYYLTEPQPPLVRATDGDFTDHVAISWELVDDRTGPPITGTTVRLLRNGAILQTLPLDQTEYLDFNVFPGEDYEYAVVPSNKLGRSHADTDLGFLNPNGTVIGKVETPNGNPVADVKVVLTPNLGRSADLEEEAYVFFPKQVPGLAQSYTVEGWFRSIAPQEQTLFAAVDSGTTRPFVRIQLTNTGALRWEHRGGGSETSEMLTTPGNYTFDGAWHHFAAVLDTADLSRILYVDGRIAARDQVAGATGAEQVQVVLGKKGPLEHEQYYQGRLDDWRLWSVPRTRAQIRRDLDRTLRGVEAGLEAYWKFDEAKGETVFDLTNHDHDGQICKVGRSDIIAPVYVSGITDSAGNYALNGIYYGAGNIFTATPKKTTPIGTSLELDGVDDHLAFARDRLDLRGGYTIEMWFKNPGGGLDMTLFAATRPADGGSQIRLDLLADGRLRLTHLGTTLTSTESYNDEYWYHLAATHNTADGALALLVNGQVVASSTGAAIGEPSAYAIGRYAPEVSAGYYRGWLDEIRVWDRGRSPEQVAAVRSQVLAGTETGLIAYWKLNEGDGLLAIDATAGSHTGSLQGQVRWTDDIPLNEVFTNTFEPESRQVALNPSNTSVDRVDFTDISLIAVSGFVRYSGTTCLIEGAEILVNGQSLIPPRYTGPDGKFTVEFEPGSTRQRLSVAYRGHEVSPAFIELPRITTPISGLFFEDTTKRTLTGQVAGGARRLPITPQQGQTQITLTSVDGCIETTVSPDPVTGRYQVQGLPPVVYNVSLDHPDPTIDGFFTAQQLSLEEGDGEHDFIYLAPPQVAVRGFPLNACGLRVMEMAGAYDLQVDVFETYVSNGVAQTSPASSGSLTVFDGIGDRGQVQLQYTDGTATYHVLPKFPNITGGGAHPYQKRIQVTATDSLERSATVEEWVYVTGNRPRQINFATTTPQMPFLILRQPPGDQSRAFLEQGQTIASSMSFGYNTGTQTNEFATVHLGPDIEFEAGVFFSVTTAIDITLDYTAEFGFTQSQSTTQEQTWSFTATDGFATAGGGDVYVGGAMNLLYGITDVLEIDEATCSPVVRPDLVVIPKGFATTFIYSESFIRDSVIPEVEQLGDTQSADLWRSFLTRNQALKQAATFNRNISFDAGTEFSYTETTELTKTTTQEFEMTIDRGVALAVGATLNGVGAEGGVNVTCSMTQGSSQSNSATTTNTVGFTLADDEEGDNFSLNVKKDPVYGTPVFEVVSGESSCPYEPGTVPVDGPQLSISPAQQVNVDPLAPAVFNLSLGNVSQTEADRTYKLRVIQDSNPHGAAVALNGIFAEDGLLFDVPFGQAVQAIVSVFRGPTEYNYDDLVLELGSACESRLSFGNIDNIFDQDSVSVHFTVPCSEVHIASPEAGWLVTADDQMDAIQVTLDGYNRHDPNLERLELQYRPASGGDWFVAATIPRAQLTEDFKLVNWNIQPSLIADGQYQLRAQAVCGIGRVPGTSAMVQGRIDRASPLVLGLPDPADGILGPGDAIGVRFGEDIECSEIQAGAGTIALTNTVTGQPVDFDFTCGGGELTIEPSVQNAFIENATLRATIGPVEDLFGNRGSAPVEWELFVDRNPVAWESPDLSDVVVFVDQDFKTTPKLVNRGGTARSFEITGVPVWLEVQPTSGMLPPGGSQKISLSANVAEIGAGHFRQTLQASGALGDEPLPVDLRVLYHPPAWGAVDPTDFQHSMTITATLETDGELSPDHYDRVGAFIDGQLRGLAEVAFVPALEGLAGTHPYLVFLTVYGNDTEVGRDLKLRVWDASAGQELGLVEESFSFRGNSRLGSPTSPTTITATSQIIRTLSFSDGWNWFSLNLIPDDLSVNGVLGGLNASAGDLIRNQSQFSQYVAGSGWFGSLQDLAIGSRYLLHLNRPATLEIVGYAVNTETTPIPVSRGWNWIGYLPQSSMDVNRALGSLPAQTGDIIKGQVGFAQFVEGRGWIGSLRFLQPFEAYELYSQDPGTLTYPDPPAGKPVAPGATTAPVVVARDWRVDPRRYRYSMSLIAEVAGQCRLDSEGDAVAAYIGDQLRGAAPALLVSDQDRHLVFATIYSDEEQAGPVTFRFYDAEAGAEVFVPTEIDFAAHTVVGSIREPLALETRQARLGDRGFVPDQFMLSPGYPNPFNPSTQIGYGLPAAGQVDLAIYNTAGQRIRTLVSGHEPAGYRRVVWDGRDDQGRAATSGLYFSVMQAGKFRATHKLVLLK